MRAENHEQGSHLREQITVLRQIENWLEMPMFVLSLLWVGLLVLELGWELSPWQQTIVTAVWVAFVVEFVF
jgi:voltage-gated potassium channel